MKSCEFITFYELCSQGGELLCRRLSRASWAPQLPLTNSLPDYYIGNGTPSRPRGLAAEQGMRDAFDHSMVWLHDVIQILAVANKVLSQS